MAVGGKTITRFLVGIQSADSLEEKNRLQFVCRIATPGAGLTMTSEIGSIEPIEDRGHDLSPCRRGKNQHGDLAFIETTKLSSALGIRNRCAIQRLRQGLRPADPASLDRPFRRAFYFPPAHETTVRF